MWLGLPKPNTTTDFLFFLGVPPRPRPVPGIEQMPVILWFIIKNIYIWSSSQVLAQSICLAGDEAVQIKRGKIVSDLAYHVKKFTISHAM